MAAVERIQRRQSEGHIRRDSFRLEPLDCLPTVRGDGLPAAAKNLAALGSAIGADECLRNGGPRHAVERDAVRHDDLLYVLELKVFDPTKVGRVEALPQPLKRRPQRLEPRGLLRGKLLRDLGNGVADAEVDGLCQVRAQLGELRLRGGVGLEEVAVD